MIFDVTPFHYSEEDRCISMSTELPPFNHFLLGVNSMEAWQINIGRLQHMGLLTAVAQSTMEVRLYAYEEVDEE